MRINNVERWRKEIENTMKETFDFVETAERIENEQKFFVIHSPIRIKNNENKPFMTIEVMGNGDIVLWNESDWSVHYIMSTDHYKNRMAMLCKAVYLITSLMNILEKGAAV